MSIFQKSPIRYVARGGVLVLLLGAAEIQAADNKQEEICEGASYVGRRMAEQRDEGVPEEHWRQIIDKLKRTPGTTSADINFYRGLMKAVYHDFKHKTPEAISVAAYAACMAPK